MVNSFGLSRSPVKRLVVRIPTTHRQFPTSRRAFCLSFHSNLHPHRCLTKKDGSQTTLTHSLTHVLSPSKLKLPSSSGSIWRDPESLRRVLHFGGQTIGDFDRRRLCEPLTTRNSNWSHFSSYQFTLVSCSNYQWS